MKSYTDLEQSKKLAKILPLESADLWWSRACIINDETLHIGYSVEPINHSQFKYTDEDIPCWSLAALLDILDYPQLSKDKLGSGKTGWMVSVYPDNCRYDSCWHDNSVDACYEMILKLHKEKLL